MYAEVLNENGKPGLALPYLNDVRERARKTNPIDPRRDQQAYIPATTTNTLPDITETDQERLKEIIWKERRCELAMEGWRRDDLMRQKRFGTVYALLMQPNIIPRKVPILETTEIICFRYRKVKGIRATIFFPKIRVFNMNKMRGRIL